MSQGLEQVAKEMRERFSAGDDRPNADLIAQHAGDAAHMLTRWADRITSAIPANQPPTETLNREMADALKGCLSLIEDLMPGVRNIALQDYAKLNDVPVAAHSALAKFRTAIGEDTRDPVTAYYEDRNGSGQSALAH